MELSPDEAEEALAVIETMVQKTRQAISKSGAYAFLIVWGVIWLLGFLSSHFLPGEIASNAWIALDIVGALLSIFVGVRMNRVVRNSTSAATGKRIAWFWLFVFFFCGAAIGVASPIDGKQLAMFIILFVILGWMAMSLLLSFASVWGGLAIAALALISYFLLPDLFYLWMAILGGGGMIALGIIIRNRW